MKPALKPDLLLMTCKTAVQQAGGPKKLSQKLGISSQAVGKWTQVPSKRVLVVEKVSGISRHVLRPDIYGKAPQSAPEENGMVPA